VSAEKERDEDAAEQPHDQRREPEPDTLDEAEDDPEPTPLLPGQWL
jgi:hypothetical protein